MRTYVHDSDPATTPNSVRRLDDDRPRFARPVAPPPARPLLGFRHAVHWQAWMLVLPVDAALLALPVLWLPQYAKAVLVMTVIAIALLSGGGRYATGRGCTWRCSTSCPR